MRYAFFMLVPLALVVLSVMGVSQHGGHSGQTPLRLDRVALAAALPVCSWSRPGQRLLAGLPEIILEIVIGAVRSMRFHSFMADKPFLDLRLLDNNYSLGLLIVLIYGMLNFTPMVVMPPMLKDLGGYPEAIIGTLLARGAGRS